MYFGGLDQIIPSYYNDFPDGIVVLIRNYGICKDWIDEFVSTAGAQNGNMVFVKPGKCLTVAPENGSNREHWQIIPQNCWMEKLYPFCKHNFLHKYQYQVLKGLKYPDEKYHDYKYIYSVDVYDFG